MKHKISVVQMVSSTQVDLNLLRAEALIEEAVRSSRFVFLPENFAALGRDDPVAIGRAESIADGPVRRFLGEMARRYQCWIFAGTIPLCTRPDGVPVPNGRVRAASLVYDPSGSEVSRYDKIHMFDVEVSDHQGTYKESDTFEPGEDIVCVESPLGRVGLTVCYDIRFPELYRHLFELEVDAVAVPSAFTEVTGEAHFELLMRARAVENTCFMIAACQGGVHDSGRRTFGHSMVVDPWGTVLGQLEKGEGVLVVEIDLSTRQKIRQDMPFHQQRRV
ncbi:MAG: carbon-nitrogen hydrolase family protein [Gammaproteobacteria bacterium]|jgi:deaminated glutathione amidase|nr:carbon-nitrogen hydrolase family protein [Gammaproteobacteria bacterium]MBT4493378.1 carbon-nitrogen hydrolase family protein [Gammaproteobacteria bacterium]